MTHHNWHNARNNGHSDADFTAVLDELDEGGRLEEELRDNHVGARIAFRLQILQIGIVGRVRMALGVAY